MELPRTTGRQKALNRTGFLSRGIMRRLFRTRKNPKRHSISPAAPFNHVPSRQFGLKMVLYAYSKAKDNVVVGPIGSTTGRNAVPGLLNDGGRVQMKFPKTEIKFISGIPVRQFTGDHVYKTASYRPRKFVKPTLDAFKTVAPKAIKGVYNA